MNRFLLAVMLAPLAISSAAAQRLAPYDVNRAPTFIDGLTNVFPLAFGMSADDATRALGVPLSYLRGRPGNEIFVAVRPDGGSGFFPRSDQLYLQFRNYRLTGVKADWGRDWLWQ